MTVPYSSGMSASTAISMMNNEAQWYFGITAPATTHPYLNWADTANNLWKQRNTADNAWIIKGKLDGAYWGAMPIAGGNQTGAFCNPLPASITSASGVLTLTTASEYFIVNGSEAITSIAGWTQGIAVIRWNTVRTLTNSANLILQNASNKVTGIGDIGLYVFDTNSIVREISYFVASVAKSNVIPMAIALGG